MPVDDGGQSGATVAVATRSVRRDGPAQSVASGGTTPDGAVEQPQPGERMATYGFVAEQLRKRHPGTEGDVRGTATVSRSEQLIVLGDGAPCQLLGSLANAR